ncbi:MAG TPA: AAA family ATPase, partial [Blastocatellia bacterium]
KNTVIIMTSNIGSRDIQQWQGDEKTMRSKVMDQLRSEFRPEFLNRVDDVIIFKSLGIEQLRRIIEIQLESLRRALEDRNVALTVDESAEELIAREGSDPVYGARPLKRAIQNLIQNPLAMKLLSGEIKPNEPVLIRGDLDRGQMIFEAGGGGR